MTAADWLGLILMAGTLLACIVAGAWALDGLLGGDDQ